MDHHGLIQNKSILVDTILSIEDGTVFDHCHFFFTKDGFLQTTGQYQLVECKLSFYDPNNDNPEYMTVTTTCTDSFAQLERD